jgi:hypothetical protein
MIFLNDIFRHYTHDIDTIGQVNLLKAEKGFKIR